MITISSFMRTALAACPWYPCPGDCNEGAELAWAARDRLRTSAAHGAAAGSPARPILLPAVASWGSLRGCCSLPGQELEQQPIDLVRPLLLDPVPGPCHQVDAAHPRARLALHAVEIARSLVNAPVALARDEAGRHVDRPPGPHLQLRAHPLVGQVAIPLQRALEAGPR